MSESTVSKEKIKSTGKSISYSQYAMWLKCPYSWKLGYMDGLKKYEPSIHTAFGTAIHEAIQTFLEALFGEGAKVADELDVIQIFEDVFAKELKGIIRVSRKDEEGNHILNENHEKIYDEIENPLEVSDDDLNTFTEHGHLIINHMIAYGTRTKFFSTDRYELVGIETPINMPVLNNLTFIGYLDIVLREKASGRIKIIDLKTSTRMWNKYQQNDVGKLYQLLFYKVFYSKQFDVSVDKIDVEFIILKRTLLEGTSFPEDRTQRVVPPSGKIMMDEAVNSLVDFIHEGFTDEGKYNTEGTFRKNPHKGKTRYSNCKYCDFSVKNGGDCDRGQAEEKAAKAAAKAKAKEETE